MIQRSAAIGIVIALNAVLSSAAQAEATGCQGKTFTPAEGVTALCSATWQFTGGICKEQDLVYEWKIQGTTSPPGWNIPPWEKHPITIRGVELTMANDGEQLERIARIALAKRPWWRRWFSRDVDDTLEGTTANKTIWWMAGNNYVPDAMLFLGSNERHGRHIFPNGFGMPFPPVGAKNAYLDLHGACSGGGAVSFFYTVYYSLP